MSTLKEFREDAARARQMYREAKREAAERRKARRAGQKQSDVPRPRRGNRFSCTLGGPKRPITLNIRDSTLERVKAEAQREGLSMSEMVDKLLDRAFQQMIASQGHQSMQRSIESVLLKDEFRPISFGRKGY